MTGESVPYLPKFAHDVFVSYGHGPMPFDGYDGARTDFLSRWTRGLIDDLTSELDIILGTKDNDRRVAIWMDPALSGNQPLSKDLKTQVESSALLLVVMSHFYVDSDWCGKELEWFTAREAATDGKIFVVKAFNIDQTRWPSALKPGGDALPGYKFFEAANAQDRGKPLGWPEPDDADKEYRDQLWKLANEVASELKRLEWAQNAPAAAEVVPDRVGRTIFLGYMHDSLQKVRSDLRARLDQSGFKVFPPADSDPVDESSLVDSFARYLPASQAIVLIANQFSERWPKGQIGGPLGLQLDLARKRKVPACLWLQIDDFDRIENEQFRAFLTSLRSNADGQAPGENVELRFDDMEAFVDYISRKLDIPSASLPPGAEQFAVVCSNVKPGQPYESFQSTIIDTLSDSDRSCIIAEQDQASGQIRLANLKDDIARADTLVILCFDQAWDWATRILTQIRPLIGNRADKKRLFVVGPKHLDKGQFVTGFKFKTIVGVTPQNVIETAAVTDQIRRVLSGPA